MKFEPVLLQVADMAEILRCGQRTVWKRHKEGMIPAPVVIGGSTRWRADEIQQWIDAGCPARDDWERMKAKG